MLLVTAVRFGASKLVEPKNSLCWRQRDIFTVDQSLVMTKFSFILFVFPKMFLVLSLLVQDLSPVSLIRLLLEQKVITIAEAAQKALSVKFQSLNMCPC